MAEGALIGAIAAALLTALARRFGWLSESGQWSALACGTAAAAAGWPWAALLVAYFGAATAVTALGANRKAVRTHQTNPQASPRTATQVAANGAIFALLAVKAGPHTASLWAAGATGALAAASADTWATEIGTLWGGRPRSIVTGRLSEVGMSGAITATGILAGLAGAALVAGLAAWVHRVEPAWPFFLAAAAGGVAGMIADSLLGATLQARRWCEHCKAWTERRVHPCSYRTVHAAGSRWVSNDVVNAMTTAVGAAVAIGAAVVLR